MPSDAPREGGHDAAMLDVELCIADLGFAIVDRSGRRTRRSAVRWSRFAPFRNHLAVARRAKSSRLQLRAVRSRSQAARWPGQYLSQARVDGEEKIARTISPSLKSIP